MNSAAATARLKVELVSGQSTATAIRATNPLKLLVPRARGDSVWAYLGSYGGGFVAGDVTSIDIHLEAGARCFLSSQASTKIYRNPRHRPCGHTLRARLEANSLLVLAPDPIQSFAGSAYAQRQEFHLQPGANLVLLDWFCSGRMARQERWNFTRLQSRNDIYLAEERVMVDSLLLDPADGPLDGSHRMGRFNCVALMGIIGTGVAGEASRLLKEVEAEPIAPRGGFIMSASPIRDGAVLRFAGESTETVAREIRQRLAFIQNLLGDNPWARKW